MERLNQLATLARGKFNPTEKGRSLGDTWTTLWDPKSCRVAMVRDLSQPMKFVSTSSYVLPCAVTIRRKRYRMAIKVYWTTRKVDPTLEARSNSRFMGRS